MNFLIIPNATVANLLRSKNKFKGWAQECLLLPYSIDILLNQNACEVNGPYHYVTTMQTESTQKNITPEYRLNGFSLLKKEMISGIGLNYVELPFWDIDNKIQDDSAIRKYLKKRLDG